MPGETVPERRCSVGVARVGGAGEIVLREEVPGEMVPREVGVMHSGKVRKEGPEVRGQRSGLLLCQVPDSFYAPSYYCICILWNAMETS